MNPEADNAATRMPRSQWKIDRIIPRDTKTDALLWEYWFVQSTPYGAGAFMELRGAIGGVTIRSEPMTLSLMQATSRETVDIFAQRFELALITAYRAGQSGRVVA